MHADDVTERYVRLLHRRAHEEVALGPLVELMTKVERPFLTLITDTHTPQMVLGRVCLIGDAAVTPRPHAGAGGATVVPSDPSMRWGLASLIEVPSALAQI